MPECYASAWRGAIDCIEWSAAGRGAIPVRRRIMAAKRVTIQDVARAANVHASTVSRALNPRTRQLVTPLVADRVRSVAGRLGYVPDPVAAGLRTRRTATVGVLIPDIANPFFPPLLRGIEATLGEAGHPQLGDPLSHRNLVSHERAIGRDEGAG